MDLYAGVLVYARVCIMSMWVRIVAYSLRRSSVLGHLRERPLTCRSAPAPAPAVSAQLDGALGRVSAAFTHVRVVSYGFESLAPPPRPHRSLEPFRPCVRTSGTHTHTPSPMRIPFRQLFRREELRWRRRPQLCLPNDSSSHRRRSSAAPPLPPPRWQATACLSSASVEQRATASLTRTSHVVGRVSSAGGAGAGAGALLLECPRSSAPGASKARFRRRRLSRVRLLRWLGFSRPPSPFFGRRRPAFERIARRPLRGRAFVSVSQLICASKSTDSTLDRRGTAR